MSLLRSGGVGAFLLVSLAACADTADSPVAPAEPALAVNEISPTSGSVNGGTEIAVAGAGFQGGTTVTFGGIPATRVRVASSRVLFAIAPVHPAGDVDVVVTNPDGQSTSPPMHYRYTEPGPWDY